MELVFHEVANLFPLMTGTEYEQLKADISENGQREPIVIIRNQIIDGRNRYRACLEVGVEPECQLYDGEEKDLVKFVLSLNLHRRHLNESQRSRIAGKIATMKRGDNQHASIEATSQSKAGEMLNVSRSNVQRAVKYQRDGIPELDEKVASGEVSVSAASDIAELPHDEQQEVVVMSEQEILRKAKEIRQRKAEVSRRERIKKITEISTNNEPLRPDVGTFNVIYADPPWRYEHARTENRAIENHYPTMDLQEICDLPIDNIAANDCMLFLWATAPKLEESIRVVESWGFTYRTCMVWVKDKIGMGYYARSQHELLLIAKRGDIPAPPTNSRVSSVVRSPRGEHSKKPVEFYEIIEGMYPELRKIELFCRSPRQGWHVWGNQSGEEVHERSA